MANSWLEFEKKKFLLITSHSLFTRRGDEIMSVHDFQPYLSIAPDNVFTSSVTKQPLEKSAV